MAMSCQTGWVWVLQAGRGPRVLTADMLTAAVNLPGMLTAVMSAVVKNVIGTV
jgi:hypothetical protein